MSGTTHSAGNMMFNVDCIDVMHACDDDSVDFILTDPPYVTRYRHREGRTVANNDNGQWLRPAFAQMHRLLKEGQLVSASMAGTRSIFL